MCSSEKNEGKGEIVRSPERRASQGAKKMSILIYTPLRRATRSCVGNRSYPFRSYGVMGRKRLSRRDFLFGRQGATSRGGRSATGAHLLQCVAAGGAEQARWTDESQTRARWRSRERIPRALR